MVCALHVTTTGTRCWNASASEPGPGLRDQQVATRPGRSATRSGEAEACSRPPTAAAQRPPGSRRAAGCRRRPRSRASAASAASSASQSGCISGEPLPPKSTSTAKSSAAMPELAPRARRARAGPRPRRSAGAAPSPTCGRSRSGGQAQRARLPPRASLADDRRGPRPAPSRSAAGNRRSRSAARGRACRACAAAHGVAQDRVEVRDQGHRERGRPRRAGTRPRAPRAARAAAG